MSNAVKPIPEGVSAITPYLVIKGVDEAIEFYIRVFGAANVCRMVHPQNGSVMHAELKISGAQIFLSEECPEYGSKSPLTIGGTPVSIHLYCQDADATYAKALAAGATSQMPPADMFWGDRFAKVQDPFGHEWSLATHIEDVSPEEMPERMAEAFAQPAS